MWVALCTEATTCTIESVAVQAWLSVIVSGPSRSDYDVVVREREHFSSFLRSLADHSSCLGNDFADLCNHSRSSRLVLQRLIWPLPEDFQPQPDPNDDMNDDGSASI